MFRSGYLTLVRWRGTPVRLHWSILLGALVFGGYSLRPGSLLGFVLLIFLHELGHAMMVWRFGHEVTSIEVTGIGGECAWAGNATALQRSAIAWGGVLAQLALLLGTDVALRVAGPPGIPFTRDLVNLFTATNLFLMVVNLLPIPPLDGARAWQIFGLLRARWRERRANGKRGLPRERPWPVARREPDRARTGSARRGHLRVVTTHSEPDPLASGAKPSDEAQREIDALLRRTAARLERDNEES